MAKSTNESQAYYSPEAHTGYVPQVDCCAFQHQQVDTVHMYIHNIQPAIFKIKLSYQVAIEFIS